RSGREPPRQPASRRGLAIAAARNRSEAPAARSGLAEKALERPAGRSAPEPEGTAVERWVDSAGAPEHSVVWGQLEQSVRHPSCGRPTPVSPERSFPEGRDWP